MPRVGSLLRLSLGVLLLTSMLGSRDAAALPGQVLSEQKISDLAGGFTGTLDDSDSFGTSVTSLGDLDNDGVVDIAVGALTDDDGGTNRGAVWVLLMNSDGTVKAHQKISATAGGFSGTLDDSDFFGASLAGLGDLDGDNIPDLAVGAYGDDDGGATRGAVWIVFLNTNGTVKGQQKISDTVGGFGGTLDNTDEFGYSVAALGDLDGDNVTELAVGALLDDDGGIDRGAVWILFMDTDGTVDSETKISEATAGLAGSLADSDFFGSSVARLGDLDGDGTEDVAVGTQMDDDGGTDRGAVYVIFLTAAGGIDAIQKISDTAGGFIGTLDNSDLFGYSVLGIRDLDGDDIDDLIVGAANDDDGGPNRGAVWVLFMNTDGTVASHRKISTTLGALTGPLDDGDMFGVSLATPRDLNGDGLADLIVGAWRDDDGGTNRGAAYVLFLDAVFGAFCGDTVLDPGEDCDDGNEDSGDCCSSICEFEANGAPCPNGTVCDGDEECDGAGTCTPGTPLMCDDGNLCTQDLCDSVLGCQTTSGPAPVCDSPGKGSIDITLKPDPNKNKINWKWMKGPQVDYGELGTPNSSTNYALCIYDGESGSPVFETKMEVPFGGNWTTNGTTTWKYKDKLLTQDGVLSIMLKSGAALKTKALVKAKGGNIVMPVPEGPAAYFEQNPSVIVQLLNDDGMCWTSIFTPPATKNNDERFKDSLP